MAIPSRLPIPSQSPIPFDTDLDGNHILNDILLRLPASEREIVSRKLEFVRLKKNQILYEPGESLKSGYFCNSGLISAITVFSDGSTVEVGLLGKEGFVGLPLLSRFRTAPTRFEIQIEGTAFRIDRNALWEVLPQCPALERELHLRLQIMAMQATQLAACNQLHEVVGRLARWLLMCADRIGSDSVNLTQDRLAQMLGTRRSSVTVAAALLEKAGTIAHTRGDVRIIDRPKLKEFSCECYQIMVSQVDSWQRDLT